MFCKSIFYVEYRVCGAGSKSTRQHDSGESHFASALGSCLVPPVRLLCPGLPRYATWLCIREGEVFSGDVLRIDSADATESETVLRLKLQLETVQLEKLKGA